MCVFSFGAFSSEKPNTPEYIEGALNVTAEQVIELVLSDENVMVIDSRKQTEFAKGHIEGAVNILNTRMTQDVLLKLVPDKKTKIVFYCNGERCMRSANAINKALLWRYSNIFWFRGGWKEWTEKQLPVIAK